MWQTECGSTFPNLYSAHAQLDSVVVGLDEKPLVADLPSLLRVEHGPIKQHPDLLVLSRVHKALVLANGQHAALAWAKPVKAPNCKSHDFSHKK